MGNKMIDYPDASEVQNDFNVPVKATPKESASVLKTEKQLLGALMSVNANPEIILGELILTIRPDWFMNIQHRNIMIVLQLMIKRGDVIMPELIAQFSQVKNSYKADESQIVSELNALKVHWVRFAKRQRQAEKKMIEGLIDVVRDRFIGSYLSNLDKRVKDITKSDKTNKEKLALITQNIDEMAETFSIPVAKEKGMNLIDAVARSVVLRDAQLKGEKVELGMPTGFIELDQAIGGFGIKRGKVYGLGGLSGMGKTTLGVNILTHIVKLNYNGVFFSYEMSEEDIQYKILGAETGIPFIKIQNGLLDAKEWNAVTEKANALGQLSLTYLGYKELKSPDISVLEQRLRKDVEENKVDVVLVDHIALISDDSLKDKTDTARITSVARKLSRLAKELNVAIIIICQLNRDVEKRNSKRPTSSDVKNSGAIWEECDAFIFVHRESRFETEGTHDKNSERYGTIIVGKNRFGRENIDVSVIAELDLARFSNIPDDCILP